jgi:hypothetical protein
MKNFMVIRKTLLVIIFSLMVTPAFALVVSDQDLATEGLQFYYALNNDAYIADTSAPSSNLHRVSFV